MSDKGRSGGVGDEDKLKTGGGGGEGKQTKKWYKRKIRKAKHVVLFPFREVKRRLYRNQHHHLKKKDTNVDDATDRGKTCRNTRRISSSNSTGTESCCCLCYVRRPLTLNSPPSAAAASPSSQTIDLNSPSFSYELSKALIENNDFYSKECNVHIDLDEDISHVSE